MKEYETITFYEGVYAALSNFSAHTVEYLGCVYPTAEHAYQVAKFKDNTVREKIRKAPSAFLAREYGQQQEGRTQAFDKVAVMENIMRAKMEQHTDVRAMLEGTGSKQLLKNHPDDYFWGTGSDGSGENIMGIIWMKIRDDVY